ncbi:MAG: hypothetical protein QHH43_00560 [Candidatus Saccharicenans sp.]|jgi:hypothetical protein|nr:hypothetical protein [Candidatus Saccharicenans sp.]MDH7574235.1 hypothetical protein [Candidatus Saccharicenans sp.]
MEKDKIELQKASILTTLIPEISFDVIGRISPSLLLILTILVDLGYFKNGQPFSISNLINISGGTLLGIIFALSVIAYIIGLFLSNLSYIFFGTFATQVWKKSVGENRVKSICNLLASIYSGEYAHEYELIYKKKWEEYNLYDFDRIYTDTHEMLKNHNMYANQLLQKLSGEFIYFQTLALSVLIWFIFHLFLKGISLNSIIIALATLFMFLICRDRAKRRYGRLVLRQISLFFANYNEILTSRKI